MGLRETGEHSTIAAPNGDGGGGPRDVAATEIGTPELKSSPGRPTRGAEEFADTGRGVGEADGVAYLSVRLLNVVCVFVCACGCVCVGERTSGELTKRTKRMRKEQKYT